MGEGGIGLDGYTGIPDCTVVGISSAASKILCTEHNSGLSLLDSVAKKLSEALGSFHETRSGSVAVELDGPLFERWLMKVSMGYLAAGHTPLGRRFPSNPSVVAALFGTIPMEPPIGMYSMVGVARHTDRVKEVLFRELVAIDPSGTSRVVGAMVALHGIPFLFSFGGPFPIEDYLRRPDGKSYLDPYDCTSARAVFHPPYLRVSNEGKKQLEVHIRWPTSTVESRTTL
ncbi:hypothetical protein WKW80_24585 [Variovorax humicola]|uniref:Uncharacterized protein n=1 Tax=Variovorax humicola TaxID=1769758 RepID=A0ABU8W5H4_9BURK